MNANRENIQKIFFRNIKIITTGDINHRINNYVIDLFKCLQ